MAESIAVMITRAPYGLEEGFAGARLALACMVSGIVPKVSIILVGDGTLNALTAQKPEAVAMPSNLEALQDVLDMDSPVYCAEEDLRSRVGDMEVMQGIKLISWEEVRGILRDHELITTF